MGIRVLGAPSSWAGEGGVVITVLYCTHIHVAFYFGRILQYNMSPPVELAHIVHLQLHNPQASLSPEYGALDWPENIR